MSLRLTYEELAGYPAVTICCLCSEPSCQLERVTFPCGWMTCAECCCSVLCGMSVSSWPVSDFFPIWIPRGEEKSLRIHKYCLQNSEKCWLQQLSTLVIISLPGNILTRLFNELLRRIKPLLLALRCWHALLHRTSSRHNVCLPGMLSRKNFCPLHYIKYLV